MDPKEQNPDIAEIINVVRQENRSTRIVFGVSIIILSVILMFIAPDVIRLQTQKAFSPTPDMTASVERDITPTNAKPAATTTTSSSTPVAP